MEFGSGQALAVDSLTAAPRVVGSAPAPLLDDRETRCFPMTAAQCLRQLRSHLLSPLVVLAGSRTIRRYRTLNHDLDFES